MRVRVKKECCACGKFLGILVWDVKCDTYMRNKEGEIVTTGYCDACRDKARKQLDEIMKK